VLTTVVLVRHGETDWNRERRFQGHADVPLNDAGVAQAHELAERLDGERFAAVYTSPLVRAAQTAAIVAARQGLAPQEDAALKEVDLGSWTGLTVSEVEARFPEGFALWAERRATGWEGGETYDELAARVVPGVQVLADRHRGGKVLVVTHGGPMRALLASALSLHEHQVHSAVGPLENCAVVRIGFRDGKLEAADRRPWPGPTRTAPRSG
jgi:broad specificity phosphatase PhoE